ncbi:MAG: DUF3887 domain-containing protein [Pyrinomonadaceae bacterium]
MFEKWDFKGVHGYFDQLMQGSLPPEKLQEAWTSVTEQAGLFKRQVSVHEEKIDKLNIVVVRCEFEKVWINVRITFDENDKISGLFFVPATAQRS